MGVGGQHHAPGALLPGKTQYPLYRRLGGPQGQPGRVQIISHPPGFSPQTIRPIASRYTYWAIPAHLLNGITWCKHLFVCVGIHQQLPGSVSPHSSSAWPTEGWQRRLEYVSNVSYIASECWQVLFVHSCFKRSFYTAFNSLNNQLFYVKDATITTPQ